MVGRSPKIPPGGETPRRLADSVNQLANGRSDAYGEVTLTPNASSTVVINQSVAPESAIILTPLTLQAAAEVGNGTLFVSARSNGQFTITHANNSQTERRYAYGWIG